MKKIGERMIKDEKREDEVGRNMGRERYAIRRIDDYYAGWGVSNLVLKRCTSIIIIHENMEFGNYGN